MQKHKKVLIIDDSEMQRYIAEVIIKRSAFAEIVQGFESGRQAINYLHTIENDPEEYPDLILLDLSMPQMDGYEFLDEYVQLRDSLKDQCRIVILSSSIDGSDRLRMRQYPFVSKYLTKPFVTKMLEEL